MAKKKLEKNQALHLSPLLRYIQHNCDNNYQKTTGNTSSSPYTTQRAVNLYITSGC